MWTAEIQILNKDMIVAVVIAINFKQLQVNLKTFCDFHRIQTRGLCVSAAVLYHLSYEDSYCMGLYTFIPFMG